jgi:phosphinothricin acetyltransferase
MIVRMARTADAAEVAAVYRPWVERTAISFELEPPDAAEMSRRIAAVLPFAPWLVCEIDGRVRAYAYASRHRERAAYQWCVDAAVYVHEDERRRGIGRFLYQSLFAMLRVQGFVAAHAGITLPNAASVGLHEALGFRPVGVYPAVGYKLDAWHDVGWWQLRLVDSPARPQPPLSPEVARTLPGWNEALAHSR